MNDEATNLEPTFNLSSRDFPSLTNSFFTDKQAAISDGEKFVVFFFDDELFAIPAGEVTEVIRPLAYTPLPNSPSWLCGIANLRGEIISILDLSQFCRRTARPISPKSRFIVLKPKNYDTTVAFLIDKLSEIIVLAGEEIEVAEASFLKGEAVHKSRRIALLDTDKIFSSLLIGS